MAEAMRAKKVAICLYMVAIKVRKVDGMLVWTCAERGTAAKKQEQTKSENTHAKTRRSLRDREKIFKLSASPRGNSGFPNEKKEHAANSALPCLPVLRSSTFFSSRDSCHLDYFGGDTVLLVL